MKSHPVAERRLWASLRHLWSVGLVVGLLTTAACGGPEGSAWPAASDGQPPASGDVASESGADRVPARSGDLATVGDQSLDLVEYPVDDALSAEGGAAVASMLDTLGLDPGDVELTLGVAEGGDPTVSDWSMPGASASDILAAWLAAAPGVWHEDAFGSVVAATSESTVPDGSAAWALAVDGRFVYVRTEDRSVAEAVADAIGD